MNPSSAGDSSYHPLFDQAPAGYLETGQTGRIAWINQTALAMLGYPAELVTGRFLWEFVLERKFERLWREKLALAQASSTSEGEWNFRCFDGTLLPVEARENVVADPQGKITGLRLIFFDIRTRKKSDEAVRVSEERHRTLLGSIPQRVFFKDTELRFVSVNQLFARDLNLLPEQIVGKTDFDLFPREAAEKYRADDLRVMHSRQPETIIETNPASNARRVVEVVKAPVLGHLGQVIGILGMFTDVTSRQEAEDKIRQTQQFLQTVIDNLPIMVFIKDAETLRSVLWNKAGEDIAGVSEEAMIGKSDYDLFSREEADFFMAKDRETLARGTLLDIPEEKLKRSDGSIRFLHTKKIPIFDPEGHPRFLVGISEDITERKKAQEQLQAFADRLERSNQELQAFAYVASHDLQEPLRKVRAFGDRLLTRSSEALGPEGKDYLDRMLNAARRMQTLIEDLLSFSRISTRPQVISRIDLNLVVAEVMGDLEVRIEQTGGKILVDSLPSIEADPTQMRQLFQNLIGNGLKFHRVGVPPVIKISASTQSKGGGGAGESPATNLAVIEVSDNGIGFEEKYLDRIFAVFQRLHGRGEYEGTGVGLAICRKIVERHGGTITARSVPGEGSTFVVTLPLVQKLENNYAKTP